jgi:hypothetical protein
MSTAIVKTTDQTLPKVAEQMTPQRTEPKFTAAEIEKDCPVRLQQIGRKITERLEEAREQTKRLDDHVTAINKLIAEAQELCDVSGFNKFRELFCPQLGKSQAYALRAIAAGKTTLADHRTEQRKRKRKSRANQKAEAENSGTVTEKSKPQDAPTEAGAVEHPSTAVEQTPEPKKPWSATASDEGLRVFAAHLMELYKGTNKRPPEHFSATTVPVEIIAQLGGFLTDLANLKKSEAVKPAPAAAFRGSGAISAELPAEDAGIDADLEAPRNCPLTEVSQ